MNDKIVFNYFYGQESEMMSFYRIPKMLFTNNYFKELSTDAKVLYGLMLDRMSISIKNNWFDEEKRAFIYFSIEETMEMLNCKKNKAIGIMKELDVEVGIGLIEKKRQGQGKPSIIYVKSFMIDKIIEKQEVQKLEKQTSGLVEKYPEVEKTNLLKLEKQTSRSLKNKPLEVGKKDSNYININYTKSNYINSNPIISFESDDDMDEYEKYLEFINQKLEMDILYERYPYDKDLLDGINNLILETVLCKSGTILIAKNEYPIQVVKSKFLKLDSAHIEYVMECLKSSTSKVRNIKKYLLAVLFNAPTTMSGYYQANVNHDMPQYVNL